MFVCPACKAQLVKAKGPAGILWICPSCNGRCSTVGVLRRNVAKDVVNSLWREALSGRYPRKRRCPACNGLMTEVPVQGKEQRQYLDVCTHCLFAWLDSGEIESLPAIAIEPPPEEPLSLEARQRLALLQLDRIREKAQGEDGSTPEQRWQWIPAILGLPVELETEGLRRVPWLTWSLAFVISAVSIVAFGDLSAVIQRFGLIPSQAWRYGGLTLFTSFFIHAGILHLVGNMYFFLVFADNVEDWLGKWRFLLLLALSIVAGHVLHIIGDPRSDIPCVGASGGIAGIIAFYALKFPRAKLGLFLRVFVYFKWVSMPAYMLFLLWVAMQLLGLAEQLAGFSNVSALAHLGGAAAGLCFWLATRKE